MLEKYALILVLREVLSNPIHGYSVRETAKKSGVSIFAAKQALDYMFKKHLISLEKIGNTYQYRADLDNFLTRQWKIIFSLESIQKAKIVENILAQSKSIFSITLYGSVAIGRDDLLSDIDLLVIADVDPELRKKILARGRGFGREVNITIYNPSEWRKKANIDKVFYESVVLNSLPLYGEKPVVL